jgi:anti-anti-sigma regulatory factor
MFISKELIVFLVTVEELGDKSILHCTGDLVSGDETALLCAALGEYGRDIVLELSQVGAIDAAGVGAVISLQAAGIYLQIVNATKTIREALRITRLDSVLHNNRPVCA